MSRGPGGVRWSVALVGSVGMACSGPEGSRVPDGAPFLPLGDSDVRVEGVAASNAGAGLGGDAAPVRSLTLDHDGSGALRVTWSVGADVRVRVFDGATWSDRRIRWKGPGASLQPWQIAPAPDGPVAVDAEIEGLAGLPSLGLTAQSDHGEVPWTGSVDGVWGVDPAGRTVFAHFAGGRVVARRWDGTTWNALGDPEPARGYRAGERLGPALAFDTSGEPVVAWREPYLVPPEKDGEDRWKATRWRTIVWRWTHGVVDVLAGPGGPLDEDPRDRYPQAAPGVAVGARGAWEAAQTAPPVVAVTADGAVVVGWDTLDGAILWRHHAGAWSRLPDPVDLPGDAIDLELAAEGERLFVAWAHAADPQRPSVRDIEVRGWDGTQWTAPGRAGAGGTAAGGVSRTAGPSFAPRLVVHDGQPVVAWVDGTTGAQEVLLTRYDGARWVGLPEGRRVGGLASADQDAASPAVTWGVGGPRVFWLASDPATPEPVGVLAGASWDGASWRADPTLTFPARPGGVRAVAVGDSVVALWDARREPDPRSLRVARLEAGVWHQLGDVPVAERVAATESDLALDAKGQPWVAWAQGERAVQVRRWDGSAWVKAGTVPGAPAPGIGPAVAVGGSGRPWLAWVGPSANRDVDVKVAWFDGTDWQMVGDSWWLGCEANQTGELPVHVSLALGPDDRPVVGWLTEGVTGRGRGTARLPGLPPSIQVCAWDGRQWTSLPSPVAGAGLRSPGGRPGFDLDASSGPVVAWSEAGEGGRQIHARRWTGSAWVALGDRAGAVSDCHGACWSPSIASGPNGRCVGWEEAGDRTANVSVRCQAAP